MTPIKADLGLLDLHPYLREEDFQLMKERLIQSKFHRPGVKKEQQIGLIVWGELHSLHLRPAMPPARYRDGRQSCRLDHGTAHDI